jgi:hypothetical protein
MTRLLPLSILALTLAHCATEGEDEAQLFADDQAAPPILMDLSYDHDLIKGRPSVITVTGGPANRNINLLATANVNGAPTCPAVLAPDCLNIASPFLTLGTVLADATGTAVFSVTVPPNVNITGARLQAAAVQGRTHYLSDFPFLDVVDPPVAATIPGIRGGNFPEGTYVEISGVVNSVRSTGFGLQTNGAANAGLFVYTASAATVALGDRVTATGLVHLYDNNGALTTPADTLLELDVASPGGSWTVTSAGAPPAPTAASLAQLNDPTWLEEHECMVVRLDEANPLLVVTNPFDPAQFFEFHVAQGPGGISAEVDNEFFSLTTALPALSLGDSFDTITGVLFFSFDEYKVAVRGQVDVTSYVDVP